MKSAVKALALVVLLLVAVAASAGARDRTVKLTVAAVQNEPYAFAAEDTVRGLDVDILRLVCTSRGWLSEIRLLSQEEALTALKTGEADLALGGVYASSPRNGGLPRSSAYLNTGLVIVTRDRRGIRHIADLNGLKIAVRAHTQAHSTLLVWMRKQNINVHPVPLDSSLECFQALKSGRVEGVLNEYLNSVYLLETHFPGEMTIAPGLLGPRFFARYRLVFLFSPAFEQQASFEQALKALSGSKVLRNIKNSWDPRPRRFPIREAITWSIAGALAAILLLLYFLRVYRRRIEFRALKRSEEQYRRFIFGAPLGVSLCRIDRILMVNEQFLKIFGLKHANQAVGRPILDFLHPSVHDSARTYFEKACSGEDLNITIDTTGRREDGEVFELHIRTTAFDLPEGPGLLVFHEDITDRKTAERHLRESEQRFRALAESTSAGILIYQDEKLVYVNPAVEQITGYTAAEVRRRPFYALVHPEDRDLVKERGLLRQRGEDVPNRYEVRVERKSGEVRWIELSGGILQYEARPAGIVTGFDVTERRKAEEALRKSENRLRLLLDNVQEIINYSTVAGDPPTPTARFISRKIVSILGYTPDEFIDVPGKWFEFLHPEDRARLDESIGRLLTRKTPQTFEYRFLHKNTGEYVWIEDRVVPDFDEEGGMTAIYSVGRDITRRKKADEEILKRNRELFALLKASQAMTGFINREEAAAAICRAAMEAFDARMVWIGLVVPESTEVVPLASAGEDRGYTERIKVRWDESPEAQGPAGKSIKARKPVVNRTDDFDFAPWREEAEKRGYRAVCSLPMIHEDAVRGAILVYSSDPEAFQTKSLELLEIFAREATMVVVNAGLYEEAKRSIEELAATNEELVSAEETLMQQLEELQLRREGLEERETLFRRLADSVSTAIFILRGGRINFVNAHFSKLFGVSAQEARDKSLAGILKPRHPESLEDYLVKGGSGGENIEHLALECLAGPAPPCWVEVTVSPILLEGDEALLGTAYDITEVKTSHLALAQSETRLRSFFDELGLGVYRASREGRILHANRALASILGYASPEELSGAPLAPERFASTAARDKASSELSRTGSVFGLASRWKGKDGKPVQLRESLWAVKDTGGRVLYYEGTVEKSGRQ